MMILMLILECRNLRDTKYGLESKTRSYIPVIYYEPIEALFKRDKENCGKNGTSCQFSITIFQHLKLILK